MTDFRIPWGGRGHQFEEREIQVVAKIMWENGSLTQGTYQAEFEKAFAQYTGAKHAFAVSSCSAALELSALLTQVGPGDEVLIPAHTFPASAIPFARAGAKLIWVDIDPDTRLLSVDSIRDQITDRTKAIVVVHLYGLPADMDPIMDLAKSRNIFVVEDAAQAIGATYNGKKVGSIGDFGCFSFHTQKNMTTLGEGGMLTLNNDDLADLVGGLRHNGARSFSKNRRRYWVPAMSNFSFDINGVWPHNFCIGEIQCAVGLELLKRMDKMNQDRCSRAYKIFEALKDYPELSFQKIPEGRTHVFHLLAARYDGSNWGKTRDDFLDLLVFKHKVQAIVQYCPLYRYPLFEEFKLTQNGCVESERFFDNMVSFPFHHGMSNDQFAYMVHSIKQSLDELRGHC